MATVTKPIALDESLNTTELSSRNVADVLAQELSAVASAIGGISAPSAEDVSYDNSGSGLSATDVQNAIDELSSEKADSSSLATVATSGDYDDLINKPTIPTVNDATLTIQKNGSDVATFTANASSNVVANVTVPTTTSELTNNSDFVSDASYVHTDNNFTNAEKTKLSGIESGAEVNVQSDWNEADNTKDDYIKNKPSSEVKSATDTFTTVNGGLLEECIINLEPVQSGSGDPSPDNVRPITGHTEVDLLRCSKNNLSLTLAYVKTNNTDGTWSGNTYTLGNLVIEVITDNDDNVTAIKLTGSNGSTLRVFLCGEIVLTNGASYSLNGCPSGGSDSLYRLDIRSERSSIYNNIIDYGSGFDFTASEDITVYGYIRIARNITIPDGGLLFYPMVRTSGDATFEPYQGNLYQVQIGQTVYGGTVDLVSGVMTVTDASVDLDDLEWTRTTTSVTGKYRFYASISNNKTSNKSIPTSISSHYPLVASYQTFTNLADGYILDDSTQRIYIFIDAYSAYTESDFQTAMSGVQVCYELATPFTIQLTPQQIEALVGQNNLSTPLDGQSIDSVKYREVFAFDDVEKVVSLRVPISMLGTDESGRTTASQSYASGDYFYKDGYMCKALTSISAGATLTLNTNYSQGTLADILKAIENA